MTKQLLAFLFIGFIGSLSAQVTMFDQTSGPTTNGVLAVDHLFSTLDCRIADDFEVPTGETWYIDSVSIIGFYNGTTIDSNGMNFTIYEDNGGAVGAQVFSQVMAQDLDPGLDGIITASWTTPIQLTAGTYWLAASGIYFQFNQSPWYWYLDSVGFGNEALWEQGGGYATGCTTWTPITDSGCLEQDYGDVMFQIYGCYGSVKPTINELPEDTTFCSGPSVTITASSNTAGVMYAWNTGDSTASITVGQAGNYVVTAYDPVSQCGASSDMYLDIIPPPPSNVANDTICEGQSRTYLSACSSCSFLWNNGSTNNSITVSEQGWVSVTMTDAATGCVGVDSGWLEIELLPDVLFVPDNPAHGCEGDTMTIGTVNNYDSYFWNKAGWPSLRVTPEIEVHEEGDYYITVTNSLGCLITDTVNVQFHPLPEPIFTSTYHPVDKTKITAQEGFQTYKWSNGQTDAVIIVKNPGAYSLTVTDEFGCVGVTTRFITVPVAGVAETLPDGISIYPNPTSDILVIENSSYAATNAEVVDLNGRVVRSMTLSQTRQEMELAKLSAGTYELILYNEEQVVGHTPVVLSDK